MAIDESPWEQHYKYLLQNEQKQKKMKKNGIGHCRRRKKAVLEMQNCNSKLMRKIIPKEKHENRFKMVLSSHGGKFEQKKKHRTKEETKKILAVAKEVESWRGQ